MYPWENTAITGINTEKTVVQAFHYKSIDDAINDENKSVISLNGRWKYQIFKNLSSVAENFYGIGFEDSNWERVSVPSIVKEFNSEDSYKHLNNDSMIRRKSFNKITGKYNRIIIYRRNFHVSKRHNSGEFYLCFEGMLHSFNVYINGEFIGYSYGKLTPIEFKVSDNIMEGNNTIAIEMIEFSESTNYHSEIPPLIGIMKSIFIYYEPKIHIRDINVKYRLKEEISNCDLKVKLNLRGECIDGKSYCLEVMLGESGESLKKIGEVTYKDILDEKNINLEFQLENIKLWSCENPKLYNILFRVIDDCNEVITIKKQVIGFREIAIKNNILMINRKAAEIKGINGGNLFKKDYRFPENEKSFEEEIKRLKQFNINSIIVNEYPYPEMFYKYCDIYGIYVVDEAEVSCFNRLIGRKIAHDEQQLVYSKDRVISMIERGKNHPSIIMWSLGRVLSFGENIEELYKTIKERDKNRPVFYLGDKELAISEIFAVKEATPNFQRVTGELKELSYPVRERLKNITRGFVTTPLERYRNKPILYLSYGKFYDYQLGMLDEHINEFRKYENWIGGFLNIHSSKIIHNNEVYETKKGEKKYLFIDDGIINPIAYEIKKCFQSINVEIIDVEKLVFEIKNNYKFINTKNIDTNIKFLKEGEVIRTQIIEHPIISPSKSCIIDLNNIINEDNTNDFNQIEFSFIFNKNTEYFERGTEVAWEQFDFKSEIEELCTASKEYSNLISNDKKYRNIEDYKINNKPNNLKIENISESYLITGDNFKVTVSKLTGDILMEVNKVLNADNYYSIEVCGNRNEEHKKNKSFFFNIVKELKNKVSFSKRIIGQEIILESDCIIICFDLKDNFFGSYFTQIYKIYDDGKIYFKYIDRRNKKSKRIIPNINIHSNVKKADWYGKGPFESFPWLKKGMKLGNYRINFNEKEFISGRRCDVKNINFIFEEGVNCIIQFTNKVDIVFNNKEIVENIKKDKLNIDILSNEEVEIKKNSILYYERDLFKKDHNPDIEFIVQLGSH
ncbi:glycoside hydrolase family 2 TIM barrel-domain containing protein [Oceanirhabdus sp. W0125-5]|uniref:glycoside hydrolase family 2 TIM barrel-domain containing protein n=1 Tax=Oceanirhabdus sp. W0125-5 TaxID=2999116 RepID=UPI0022F2BC31|nr:glycoside hydrolase family 2 TIM barrel-domain containing protein [Oceanirhabdus sp. W0125-5]WBW94735.1 glycoside hydrolase family 2 TIM barrel-domain containing protein [Oceanirhabdus sp. W0125-5]